MLLIDTTANCVVSLPYSLYFYTWSVETQILNSQLQYCCTKQLLGRCDFVDHIMFKGDKPRKKNNRISHFSKRPKTTYVYVPVRSPLATVTTQAMEEVEWWIKQQSLHTDKVGEDGWDKKPLDFNTADNCMFPPDSQLWFILTITTIVL